MDKKELSSKHLLNAAVFAAGFLAITAQLTFARELLNVFEGNEMVLGIVLGNWMLLMGLGAALGRRAHRFRNPLAALTIAQLLQAILPIGTIFFLRTFRHVMWPRGLAVGLGDTILGCFAILLPFCITAGFFLVLASQLITVEAKEAKEKGIGWVYCIDNIGGMIGGALFTFALIPFLNHFQILYLSAALNLFCAVVLTWRMKQKGLLRTAAASIIVLGIIVITLDLDKISTQIEYKGQNVLYRGQSAYGDLIVTELAGQHNFIQNNVPFFSTHNIEEVEETAHYPMSQKPDAKKTLIIGGGMTGTAAEVLKYGVEQVDYVELDPLIVQKAREIVPENFSDRRISLIFDDGRAFVKKTDAQYEIVIVNAPEPVNFQINRFYTQEFFQDLKKKMTRDGVASFTLGHYENYVDEELGKMISVMHKTLRSVFQNVLMIPGGKIYFLASDGELTPNFFTQIQVKNIETHLIRLNYINVIMSQDRVADLHRALNEKSPINRDFNPILYFHHLQRWINQFEFEAGIVELILLGIVACWILSLRGVLFTIFTVGFAGAALEMVLLAGFQILYGCVYRQVGMIVSVFMLGMLLGSFWMTRTLEKRSKKDLAWLVSVLAVYAVLLPVILVALKSNWLSIWIIFPTLAFVPAMLTGMAFPLAGKLRSTEVSASKIASDLYGADYLGAFLGMLLVNTILMPMIGLTATCAVVATFCLIGTGVAALGK